MDPIDKACEVLEDDNTLKASETSRVETSESEQLESPDKISPPMTKVSVDADGDSAYYSCIDSPHGSLERNSDDINQQRRFRVLQELLITERQYVCDLRYIQDKFINTGVTHLSSEDTTIIFSNWKQLTLFHRYFLSRLELAWRDPAQIANCFTDSESHFRQYGVYCKNYFRAIQRLNRLLMNVNTSPAAAFLRSANTDLELPLHAYLLKPVQRIVKYPLLLSSLIASLPQSEAAPVVSALQRLRAIIEAVDAVQRNPECRLESLQSMLVPSGPPVYLQDHAPLLLEANVCLVERRETLRYALLLHGLLLFAKVVGTDKLLVKRTISTRHIRLLKSWPRQPTFFQLWITKKPGQISPLTLRCASAYDRDRWCDCLAELLSMQGVRTAASGSLHRVTPSQSDFDLRGLLPSDKTEDCTPRRHSAALDEEKKHGWRFARRKPLAGCPEDRQLEIVMPRRRVVDTEVVKDSSPGLAWDSNQRCEIETPPMSPTRQTPGKSSLRRSLSRTLSSIFRPSPSSPTSPSSKHTPPKLTNGTARPASPQSPQSVVRSSPNLDRHEASASLSRVYQKRPQQITPSGSSLLRKPSNHRDDAKSASCTRISDIPSNGLDTSRSHSNIAEGSSSTSTQRRWDSTLNSSKKGDSGKLRYSSTFIRKSVEHSIDIPVSPSTENIEVFDKLDGSVEYPRLSCTRHKSRVRAVKREPSRLERKEAYSTTDVRLRSSSLSGSTGALTRRPRKAPVAIMTDL